MGNSVIAKGFEDRELGEAHLDASSPKVIDSRCVTNREMQLIRKGNKWYSLSNHEEDDDDNTKRKKEETMVFGITKKRQFVGGTQVLVDEKDSIIAILHTSAAGRGFKTLVYRPRETFENQQPTMEIYTEKELQAKKKKNEDVPKFYLFARIQSSAASKCDANYSLLQVHEVYNDPDFARFHDPPLYRAAKVLGGGGALGSAFAGAVMDGTDHGGETLLGKVTISEALLSNGVDIIAIICLGLSVNQSGKSARGVDKSDVV